MKRFIYNSTILVLFLSFLSCGNSEKEPKKASAKVMQASDNSIKITRAQFEQGGLKLGSLEEKTFPIVVATNGMIDVPPENRAVVSATLGGYIKKTPLLVGDIVKKGQVLLTIENPKFVVMQQEYLMVKEQLAYLESEYKRQKILFDEKITSQKNYLRTESEYKTAHAKYKGLRKQLSMLNISLSNIESGILTAITTIYAPIGGSVTKVNVTKGTYVSPASSILEIVDTDHIHLELSVFEKDIMKIKKQQQIHFKIPEASTDSFEAEVHLIGTSINENRTIKVHGHLKNESNHNFLTGMFVKADIVIDNTFIKALPSEAIVSIDDTFYVLLLDSRNGEAYYFKQIEVQTSHNYNGFTAIKNAEKFKPTDQFLAKGTFHLIGE